MEWTSPYRVPIKANSTSELLSGCKAGSLQQQQTQGQGLQL